jgi:hypothetical protein
MVPLTQLLARNKSLLFTPKHGARITKLLFTNVDLLIQRKFDLLTLSHETINLTYAT